MKIIEGNLSVTDAKVAIVVSRFNSFIVDSLVDGALDVLKRTGGMADSDITIVRVPGAVELPLATQKVAAKGVFDAIITLGAVIRGGTPHFEFVAGGCNKGLSQVAMQYNVPVAFGVLTTDTIEQAIERAGTKMGNKGGEAALSALEMINVMRALDA